MPQTLLELAGAKDAPLMHLAPANGFPPPVYLPLMSAFRDDYRVISFPPRALWGDQQPGSYDLGWRQAADDLLSAFAAQDMSGIVALGHSFGAIISMMAVLDAPQRFRALVMMDPVLLPPNLLGMIAAAQSAGNHELMPMAQAARRRRQVFDSRDQAFRRFRQKSVFADWSYQALQLYVDAGTRERRDGQGVELLWSVDWEAYYFATIITDSWQLLRRLQGLVPVLMIRGDSSDIFGDETLGMVRDCLPSAEIHTMAGQGHFFPQAAPQATAGIISDWLDTALSQARGASRP